MIIPVILLIISTQISSGISSDVSKEIALENYRVRLSFSTFKAIYLGNNLGLPQESKSFSRDPCKSLLKINLELLQISLEVTTGKALPDFFTKSSDNFWKKKKNPGDFSRRTPEKFVWRLSWELLQSISCGIYDGILGKILGIIPEGILKNPIILGNPNVKK